MTLLGIILGIGLFIQGFRLIAKSEGNRKRYQHWSGINGADAKEDDYYFTFAVQFVLGLLMIFGSIVILCLLYYNG